MDERLVVLNEEGVYRLYDLQGDYQQYSLGAEAGELGIVDARIHENGLVALTGSLTLLEVKGWEGGRPLVLANPGISYCLLQSHSSSVHTKSRPNRTTAFMGNHSARYVHLPPCRSPPFNRVHHPHY